MVMMRDWFFGIAVFMVFILGTLELVSIAMDTSDGAETGMPGLMTQAQKDEFDNAYNIDHFQDNITNIKREVTSSVAAPEYGAFSIAMAFLKSTWNSVALLFTSFGFLDDAINNVSGRLELPSWVPSITLTFIAIMLIFWIISLVFQKDT